MSNYQIPELLAPAGSIEALKAAVNVGADAVYLSGKRFGARQFAHNFSLKEMEEAINYAHLRAVKVYVTVNTLIKETELSQVGDHLLQLHSLGADAVIVQDLGVARLVRELVPDLDLHCSTQMNIHNPKGISWAEDKGFKRVVLAREMRLKDIEITAQKNKDKNKKIELEVFAHGAICYSYSGQCLLSSFIGGRSGNRGMCAQPCRKNYQLIMAKTDKYGKYKEGEEIPLNDHYLLSTRDLAIYSHLDRIVKSPVDSIKIEGRMRPPEYVANVVKIYRGALDSVANGTWPPLENGVLKLKMCFNRGLTKGWLLDAVNDSVMGRKDPGNRGLYLGKVIKYNKNSGETIIALVNRVNLQKGDGILFKDPQKTGPHANIWGMVLENSPSTKKGKLFLKLRKQVEIGSEVFITRRKFMVVETEKIIANPHLPHPIPLEIQIKWNEKLIPLIRANAYLPNLEKVTIEYKADFSMEKAINRPLSSEIILEHLKKTGGTPFIIKNIQMDYPGNLFTPISNLNHLRREILGKVQKRILESYKPPKEEIESVETRLSNFKKNLNILIEKKDDSAPKLDTNKLNLAIYVDNISSLEAALQSECKRIYFQPKIKQTRNGKFHEDFPFLKKSPNYETYFKEINSSLKEAAALCQKSGSDLIWKWPDITSKNFIEGATTLLNTLPEDTITGVMVGNSGALWALKQCFNSLRIYGSKGLNIWNHMTIDELTESTETLFGITLSPELSKDDLKSAITHSKTKIREHNFELLVQGNLEVLVSEDCLPCVVQDKGIIKKFKNSTYQFLGIKDSKNRIFPLELDEEYRTHVLNSVELCLIDHIPKILDMGFDSLVIDSRNKPVDYILNMLPLYQDALQLAIANDPNLGSKLESLKKRVKKISNGGITTGNFIRGIKKDY